MNFKYRRRSSFLIGKSIASGLYPKTLQPEHRPWEARMVGADLPSGARVEHERHGLTDKAIALFKETAPRQIKKQGRENMV